MLNPSILFGRGVFGHSFGSFRHSVLGQFSRKKQPYGRLDFPGSNSRPEIKYNKILFNENYMKVSPTNIQINESASKFHRYRPFVIKSKMENLSKLLILSKTINLFNIPKIILKL